MVSYKAVIRQGWLWSKEYVTLKAKEQAIFVNRARPGGLNDVPNQPHGAN